MENKENRVYLDDQNHTMVIYYIFACFNVVRERSECMHMTCWLLRIGRVIEAPAGMD